MSKSFKRHSSNPTSTSIAPPSSQNRKPLSSVAIETSSSDSENAEHLPLSSTFASLKRTSTPPSSQASSSSKPILNPIVNPPKTSSQPHQFYSSLKRGLKTVDDPLEDESSSEPEDDGLDDNVILDEDEFMAEDEDDKVIDGAEEEFEEKAPPVQKPAEKTAISLKEALEFREPHVPEIGERVWINYQGGWIGGVVQRPYKGKLFIVNTFQSQELWVNPAFMRPWSKFLKD